MLHCWYKTLQNMHKWLTVSVCTHFDYHSLSKYSLIFYPIPYLFQSSSGSLYPPLTPPNINTASTIVPALWLTSCRPLKDFLSLCHLAENSGASTTRLPNSFFPEALSNTGLDESQHLPSYDHQYTLILQHVYLMDNTIVLLWDQSCC